MAAPEKRRPLVVDIKRNALDDGPGIRTTIFFKGCPLACVWCQNPEAIRIYPEIAYSAGDCLLCGSCAAACPEGAIDLQRCPLPLDRLRCRRGGTCVEHCPGKGLRLIGRYYPAAKLAALASQDLLFYENSGGGVTLSGGEPTLYPHYQEALLQALKFKQIHAQPGNMRLLSPPSL